MSQPNDAGLGWPLTPLERVEAELGGDVSRETPGEPAGLGWPE